MTDVKDLIKASDLYVAIAKGTGYQEGDIFEPIGDGILQDINPKNKGFYTNRTGGGRAPIFFVGQLIESPDFKPVEDTPEVVEPKTSSEIPSPRYRALVDGTAFKKDDIFEPVKVGLSEDRQDGKGFYHCVACGFAPIFYVGFLMASPDFELVEELWKPGEDEGLWGLTSVMGELKADYIGSPEKERITKYLEADVGFRAQEDVLSFLSEFHELIKKRSKESRRLDND